MGRRSKKDTSETKGKGGQSVDKTSPPWRSQPRQPTQGKGQKGSAPRQDRQGGGDDRFAALRPDPPSESTTPSRHNKDRFEGLRSESTSDATPESKRGSATTPSTREKGETPGGSGGKRPQRRSDRNEEDGKKEKPRHDGPPLSQAKVDILEEIDLYLEGSTLRRTDFDMRSRQYLHAIHQKGGRAKVHEALQVIHATTRGKARDSVGNWPAYVLTLLRSYFNDLKADLNETPKGVSPTASPNTFKLAPNSTPQNVLLPDFAPLSR